MITVSDNAATDIILQRIGGKCVTHAMHILGLNSISVDRSLQAQINAIYMAMDERFAGMKFGQYDDLMATYPDLKEVVEDSQVMQNAIRSAFETQDIACPRDLGLLLEMIAKDQCASGDSCKAMLDILGRQCFNTRLPRHISPLDKVLHKTGTFGNGTVVNDIGLLCKGSTPFASIAVLASEIQNPMPETDEMIGQLGKVVFDTLA
jgi:beta-lactamase class A